MSDDQFDDLKQFITSTVSQTETHLSGRIDGLDEGVQSLDERVQSLDQKVDAMHQEMVDGFAGVGEGIEQIHKRDDEQDRRLTRLEHQVAS